MRLGLAPAALLFLASAAANGESPQDFGYAVSLQTPGTAPFHRVVLPAAVYGKIVRADLGDLRVFNAAGEAVPHAFLPREPAAQPMVRTAVPLFALRAEPGGRPKHGALHVEARADGAIVSVTTGSPGAGEKPAGYLADLSAHKEAVRSLEIQPAAGKPSFAAKLTIEASDDLSQWRSVASEAPVLSLSSGEAKLERLAVEFAPQRAKYLKLTWRAADPPQLAGLRVEFGQAQAESVREWKTLAAAPVARHEYRFEPGGRYPVDRLRLRLPQPNTVAQVEILTRAAETEPWRALARTVAYRLATEAGEVTNPDILAAPAAGQPLLLRIDPRGGGIGASPPELEIGWAPHELVFAARGEGPFRLAYGKAGAPPAAYPVDSLVPGFREPNPALKILPATAGAETTLAGDAALHPAPDLKRWALWGTLVLGVAVLGAMAWRLSRQLGRPGA